MSRSDLLGPVRTVVLPQGTLRYRERGPAGGRPIVFVHGFLTNADLWRNVVPPLAAVGHRCIAPDWPLGSHELPLREPLDPWGLARLVADLLEALSLDDVVLVGNDTGGALAQMVVARHGERVGALVLTPSDAFGNWPAWWSKPLRPIGRWPSLMWLAGQPLRLRAVQRLPLVYGWVCKRHPPRSIWRGWIEPGLRSAGVRRDFGHAFRATDAAQTREAARALPSFGRPAMVVWSTERAWIYPAAHARRLAALLDARLEWVEDSYVYVPEDQPGRLAGLLADFLAKEDRLAA